MRPAAVYALPTIRETPWREAWSWFELVFEEPLDEFDTTEGDDDPAVAFEEKLSHAGDGERTYALCAVTLDGRPFALALRAGRGGSDVEAAWVTDRDGLAAARVEVWRRRRRVEDRHRIVDPDRDLVALDGCGSWVVGTFGGRVRVVNGGSLAEDGSQVFDEEAYDAAFDAVVRPAYAQGAGRSPAKGLADPHMRALAARAFEASLAPGVVVVARRVDGPTERGAWWPLRVRAADGEYDLGIAWGAHGVHFSWARELTARRVRAD